MLQSGRKKYTWKRILRHTFTGQDNQTIDIGRVLWGLAVFVFLSDTTYHLLTAHVFEALNVGTGLAAVLGTGGAALALKSHTEPHAEHGTREDSDCHDKDKGE